MFFLGTPPYSIAQQYKLAQFKQCCGFWEVSLFRSWGVSSNTSHKAKRKWKKLYTMVFVCVYPVGWCWGAVLFKLCHAFMPLDGHAQFGYMCLACSNRENWYFLQVYHFVPKPRSYHDSRNDLAFVVSHRRGKMWQTSMADILHQIFCLSRGRPRMNGELHFGKVLSSCRFESNMAARKDLIMLVQVTRESRELLNLSYSDCLKAQS